MPAPSRRAPACRTYLGHPDQALARVHGALRIAEELTYPFGVVLARFWATFVHQARGEASRVQAQADELITLARAHGIPQFESMGTMMRGWARATQGHPDDGIAEIRRGMDRLREVGQELGRPYFRAMLAEAYRGCGRMDEALGAVREALTITQRTGECMHEADLYRLQGELLSSDGPGAPHPARRGASAGRRLGVERAAEAEASLEKALATARQQKARSVELRAAVGLSRLWQRQDRVKPARRLLAEVYGAFTEGFETKDLREAKALLAELRAVHA